MEQIALSDDLTISRIVHGMWRLTEWDFSDSDTLKFVEQCFDLGVDTFDHADIYGDYTVEEQFGKSLSQNKFLNDRIKIVTKCGVKLISKNRPEHLIKHYDTSYDHIIWSAENSLKMLKRDSLDVLLIHRPDPYTEPYEVARAFNKLREEGKVKEFGVSNYLPSQFHALQAYLDFPLVTNQVEIR